MKTAIIVHGMPSKKEYFSSKGHSPSNNHWLPWIQKQLIIQGFLAQAPEFPEPYDPVYKKWESVFEQFKIDKDTVLVGHSCGAGFLVRWLSENKIKVGRVVLVAPWLDPEFILKTGFFNFKIDPNMAKRTQGIRVIVSKDDDSYIIESVEQLKNVLKGSNIMFKYFKDKGHFTLSDMKTEKFPELLNMILK